MSEDATRLRALGYVLDADDDWILPSMRLRLEDVDSLLSVPEPQLEAFHDRATWTHISPEPPPPIEADLRRAARASELSWDGWLCAWDTGGAWLDTHQLVELGEQGIQELVAHARGFQDTHRFRVRMGCAGLFLMFTWLLLGWLAGINIWLGGMLAIAGVTLYFRPRAMPEDLWGIADEEMLVRAVDAGCELLGADWEETASALGAIPIGAEHVHLLMLERSVTIETLQTRFDPAHMLQILKALSPIVDEVD